MTLDSLGRPLRDLRISVTDRCNLRCPYCMPAERFGESYSFLPRAQILSFEEIARLARLMVGLGVRKVRLTGGEPLLREDLPTLVRELAQIEGVEDLALTTNGFLLERHAHALERAGMIRLTVSLDSLDERTFRSLNGRAHGPAEVLAGIARAEQVGLFPLKINTVVVKGINDDGILQLAGHFKGSGHIVRFIEFMDVGTLNGWRMEKVFPAAAIVRRIDERYPLEPLEPSYPGEVARRYRYRDGSGEIGVIASVTRPFCGDCTRARLSTNGELYTCLFGAQGIDLKGPMRAGASDEQLRDRIAAVWRNRSDRYSEQRSADVMPSRRKVEMYRIGG